ncbi:MAG: glycosyltransferase [Bacteroidaceae bacterium]|nr:glycosyltransferase [Bacteroidaceae bacterium]
MKFSVLLSVYHRENPEFLRQCLESIENQTRLPDEIIMVKDGPLTDELESVLDEFEKKLPTLIIIPLSRNSGLGIALNEGLKHCSHELVARMDTDDICKPDRFEKQVAVFEEHPDYDLVSSWIEEFVDTTDNIRTVRTLPEMPEQIREYGKRRCPVNHPVTMFKKSSVMQAGGYQHFPLLEDYYLWARMLVSGARFYNIQESLLYFRSSDDLFKRRGGWRYAVTEVKFMWRLYRIGYVGLLSSLSNIVIRFTVRILPNSFRSWIYNRLLRK